MTRQDEEELYEAQAHASSIIQNAERMTSANYMHNVASIKNSAKIISHIIAKFL